MASTRLLLFVLLATAVAVTLAASNSKNVIVGSRVAGDYLATNEVMLKPFKWLQVITATETYPVIGNVKITQVRLLDQDLWGHGATAVVTDGGPGANYVTIQFTSEKGHGISFIIELYAK